MKKELVFLGLVWFGLFDFVEANIMDGKEIDLSIFCLVLFHWMEKDLIFV